MSAWMVQGFLFLILAHLLLPASALAGKSHPFISLSPEEKAWITEHPVIRLGVGRSYPPFQYMEPGEIFQGIASDYVKLLEQRLGFKLEIQKNLTWDQVMDKTMAGEIDAWACVSPTPDRQEYMIFSKPYLQFPWVIFMRKDHPFISDVEELKGRRVAVVKRLANYPRLKKIPDLKFVFVKTAAEGLTSVSVGKADAYILNLAVGDYLINKNGLTNLMVATATDWGTNDMCFASRRDWPMLANLLQKGLDSISQHEHNTIVGKWLHADLNLGISWGNILFWGMWLLLGVTLVFSVMLHWNHRLQREIRDRQVAEHALHKAYSEVDILVRQRTAALQESQNHLNLALDTVSAFTWEVPVTWRDESPHFDTLFFSPNAKSIFGAIESMRIPLDQLPMEAEDRQNARQLLSDFLLGREPSFYLECPVVTPDSGPLWHAHAGHVDCRDHSCQPDKIYGISVNIHHRKLIEEKLQRHASEQDELNARLLELDKVKSTIVTNVSHELRTPLTSLLGFANLTRKAFIKHFGQFAESNDGLRKQARRIEQNLNIIEEESRRLTRLINDFLDLSKIQSGRIQWNDKAVDMTQLLKRTAQAANALFLEKPAISFEVDIPEALPPLTMDPDRLEQVLQNLLHNAYKFTSAGHVRLSARQDADQLVICIEDTGAGIPKDDVEHIFTRFHRVEGGRVRQKNRWYGAGTFHLQGNRRPLPRGHHRT